MILNVTSAVRTMDESADNLAAALQSTSATVLTTPRPWVPKAALLTGQINIIDPKL